MNTTVFLGCLLVGLFGESLNLFFGGGDNPNDDDGNWINMALFSRILIGFGATGTILATLADQYYLNEYVVYGMATVNGFIIAFALKKLIQYISQSGNPSVDSISFIGMKGIVITRIGARTVGEISVVGQNKKYFLQAYSDTGEVFEVGEKISVIFTDGNFVKVKKNNFVKVKKNN